MKGLLRITFDDAVAPNILARLDAQHCHVVSNHLYFDMAYSQDSVPYIPYHRQRRLWLRPSGAECFGQIASVSATFMPRPPPPDAALTRTTANPAPILASSFVLTAPGEPGTSGKPAAAAVIFASILSPIDRM